MKNLPQFWIQLSRVLPLSDIHKIIISTITAVPKKCDAELNRAKLSCLKAVARSTLFAAASNGKINQYFHFKLVTLPKTLYLHIVFVVDSSGM
jgi:hypothetical protein